MAGEPQVVEVVADDAEALIEREQQRLMALDQIGMQLEGFKDTAVRWRADFEIEWTEDWRQYNTSARTGLAPTKREGAMPQASAEDAYRQTADNITRPKVIITASRLGDMLFPTHEANWALGPPLRPDIPDDAVPQPPAGPPDENGQPTPPQPYTPEQLMEQKREVAKKRCHGMEDEIRDQLDESRYDEVGRTTIFDACLYGTGVIDGPVLKTRRYHTYDSQPGPSMAMQQAAYPCVEYVDLWSFFPQPARTIEECEHAFRLRVLPRRAIRQLATQPGFDRLQLARLLLQDPTPGSLMEASLERGAVRPDAQMVLKDRYAVWEYRGPLPKEAFAAFVSGLLAQGVLDAAAGDQLVKALEDEPLNEIDCDVWFSQGIVLKMALSTRPRGELGYHVFNYEKNPHALFGHGVAYLCRDDQHAANQLWHAMMLNSMMSAGPQIGVKKSAVVAQGGREQSFSATKPRVWALTDDVDDINKAFSVFIVPNVTDKIIALYERAKQNADEHTMTPLIAQGEPTQAVPTSSGTAMLMNAANVVMRRLAKAWDDDITVPLISAMYEWNMAHSEDESIRGDYTVLPKGASHLLIKDVQTQHLQFATQLFAANPMLAPYMKPGAFARKNVEMLDLDVDELLYTDDQVAQNQAQQGQQPDAETIKAQAAMVTAQAAQARAEAERDTGTRKMQFDQYERELAHQERMADISSRLQIQAMQVDSQRTALAHKMAELQSSERMEMQGVIADLQKHASSIDLGQYQADQRTRMAAEQIASRERIAEVQAETHKAVAKAKPSPA